MFTYEVMRESELYVTCSIDNITCQTRKKALIIVPGAGIGATVAAHYKHHVSIHIKKIHTITLTLKTQVRYEIRNFFFYLGIGVGRRGCCRHEGERWLENG